MTTDEGTDLASRGTSSAAGGHEEPSPRGKRKAETGPSFWHRSHPTFLPLSGFFTGTVLVVLVLGGLGLILKALFDVDLSEHPGPFLVAILSLFVINVVLLVAPATRRFARYMLFGLLVTPVVVGAVGAVTLYLLISNDG
ncbi:hypothetical protein [Nocardioides sp.]|uniref:hypothetical protein n=1 Tax=Nocardioides sp. TaxID=35761 RepID=UPI002394B529|nr:hypothetical protein [Nocardioides sp.]MDE0778896.1 hypothetical protein [Nocardioides sp.]